ncbi:hypothetical protein AYO45_05460 [Gammaproteobacteria bacterium SCGC AG-212-F23]|nr:hypothetical protein AYO45_05460 [Gammaproteobacteria bacterium SCGC AG-212-F23]
MGLPDTITHIIIDEIQKIPRLLDIVQRLMKKSKKFFVMTGSSARKLKKGGANLLAGRAFVYDLFPFTSFELGSHFDLDTALQCGTLPQIISYPHENERQEFLNAYSHTYLKEEIWGEHFIRKLDPFRHFLEIAAQHNGKIINFSNIARDVGVDDKTIQAYFSILEDTLIGFFLESFHHSFRKRLSDKPKFYFFDTGVVRSLSRTINVPLLPKTLSYGNAFEHFIILECLRLANYHRLDYRFTYLRTASDVEIDLIVERPGKPLLCIEIKSNDHINANDISSMQRLCADLPHCEVVCFANEKYPKIINDIRILPWQQGLKEYFF